MKANTYHQAPDSSATRRRDARSSRAGRRSTTTTSPTRTRSPPRLRDEHPVFYAEQIGHVVVTRMEDIETVFTNPDVFASTNVQDPMFPLAPEAAAVLAADDFDPIAVMSNRPEPDHGRIRVYTRQGFSHRRLKALEDYMRDAGHRAARRDDRRRLAGRVRPSAGVPAARRDRVPADRLPAGRRRDDQVVVRQPQGVLVGKPTPEQQLAIAQGMLDYWRYCRAFVAARRDERADDFCSELLDAHDADPDPANGTGISYREVESVVYGISFAGHDPVTALLCNTLRCLLPRRDQWDALVADPALAANAVEETLRFESSQISWRRITTQDTSIGGVDLPAGTRIFLNFAAANHQPDVFDEPDVFDIHRERPTGTSASARASTSASAPGWRGSRRASCSSCCRAPPVAAPRRRSAPHFFPNITFRGPDELLVEWDH